MAKGFLVTSKITLAVNTLCSICFGGRTMIVWASPSQSAKVRARTRRLLYARIQQMNLLVLNL